MPKIILFVDDEPYYARHYVEALEKASYEVILMESAETGLQYLREHASELSLLILDYMMPTPEGVSETDTLDGLATGRWFLRKARTLIESCNTPVLVLTNRNIETVKTEIVEFSSMEVDKLLRVRHKTQTPRFYLATVVNQVLNNG